MGAFLSEGGLAERQTNNPSHLHVLVPFLNLFNHACPHLFPRAEPFSVTAFLEMSPHFSSSHSYRRDPESPLLPHAACLRSALGFGVGLDSGRFFWKNCNRCHGHHLLLGPSSSFPPEGLTKSFSCWFRVAV